MNTLPVQPKVNENHEALAPYNFIPLPEKVVTLSVKDLPHQGVYEEGRHTGYIDCELITASPVYVRAGLNPDQAKDRKQSKDLSDFFYLNDKNKPVIPGSSLRGMMRTLVEIITFSKLSTVSKSRLVYRSVGGATNHDAHYRDQMMRLDREEKTGKNTKYYTPLIKAGYLINPGGRDWFIQPAKEIDGTTYAHIGIDEDFFGELKPVQNCRNAYHIYVKTGKYEYQDVREGFLKTKFAKIVEREASPKPGLRAAVLARSGKMISKKSEAVIYEQDKSAPLFPLTDDQIDDYKAQVSKEQEKLLGKNGALNNGQPVFYIEKDAKVFFFGHARMFRVPYPNSPFDYVPDYARNDDEPKDPNKVDFAEAMFGYTRKNGKDREKAYAGRVSFQDATIIPGQKELWLSSKPVTLSILSGPKPTTFQHYLVQPEPDLYPAGKTKDGRTKFETRLSDFESPTPEDTVIRGHKFYWHKGAVSLNDISDNSKLKDKDAVHTQILPLNAGIRFKFRVNFENLSDNELGALMWIINIASDDNIRLKIGMGKPLGMGAIKINSSLVIVNPKKRYGSLLGDNKWAMGYQNSGDLAAKTIASFSNMIVDELNKDLSSEEKIDNFVKISRIRALLIMLQWPGPSRELTRYMEIEHLDEKEKRGKRNEYKERPVLPSPFGVWNKSKK